MFHQIFENFDPSNRPDGRSGSIFSAVVEDGKVEPKVVKGVIQHLSPILGMAQGLKKRKR